MTAEIPSSDQDDKLKPKSIWTTVFEINPDAFLEVQRILDTLRYKSKAPPVDPKIIESEADEMW